MTFRLLIISIFIVAQAAAQAPSQNDALKKYERELASLSFRIVNDSAQEQRRDACFKFIPKLVEALKVKSSFDYPFDSLEAISVIKPPDNTFRVFTWQLRWGDGLYRQFGAIQMNQPELMLYPLFDDSDSLENAENAVTDNDSWFGAIYYNIYQLTHKGKNYYTLIGIDMNDLWSSKKLLEVLHFQNGKPVFGAPLFEFTDTTKKKTILKRFILEYSKTSIVSLNYSVNDKMIVYDHVVPPEEKVADLKFTFVPDGTYEGFKLKKGKWVHVDKIKTININQSDNPPMPVPKK